MNLIDMPFEERYAMMRKRHAFLTETVKGYTSLALGYYDYEEYFIEPTADGQLVVSPIIAWQDFCCANGYLNIFTEEYVDSEEFFSNE